MWESSQLTLEAEKSRDSKAASENMMKTFVNIVIGPSMLERTDVLSDEKRLTEKGISESSYHLSAFERSF